MSKRVVIIGNSHGAISVIENLRRVGFQGKLTLISDEIPSYSPTALPYLLWDKKELNWPIRPAAFYRDVEIKEKKAISIDQNKSTVYLQDGKKVHFDQLVIATGASPAMLTIKKLDKPILILRKIEDLKLIKRNALGSKNILIIGAGLVGLHLAQEFLKKKKQVNVVELRDQILPGLVPSTLAHYLKEYFEEKGIRIHLGVNLTEIRSKEALFSDGKKLKSDMAISAIGIRPNIEVVKDTSIRVREGIQVNERMETSIPGIYACGDVADYIDFFTKENRLNANIINAAEQGRIVANAIAGKKCSHPGLISVNTFNCLGRNLFSLGRINLEPGDRLFEFNDPERKVFKWILYREDQLKGMVLFNTPVDGGIYYNLLKEKVSLKGLEEVILENPYLWGKWIYEKNFKG